jgi:hypothetical protein
MSDQDVNAKNISDFLPGKAEEDLARKLVADFKAAREAQRIQRSEA